MSEGHWGSPADAAARLGVSPPTITAWVKRGKLRGHRDEDTRRRSWRIDLDSVEELLAEQGAGALRGRPIGSTAHLHAEIARMNERLEALEAATTGRDDKASLAVLTELVQLLHTEGAATATRSQRVAETTEQLAALLNARTVS